MPSSSIDLQSAFEVAARLLKDDGLLLFLGAVEIFSNAETLNPTIKMKEHRYLIDTTKLLGLAGFRQGKPIKEFKS